jgi:hypothetical protein
LRQHTRQVIDELQRKRGDNEIERGGCQRQRLCIGHRQRRRAQLPDIARERGTHLISRRAEIDPVVKFAQHRLLPLRHVLRNTVEQECRHPASRHGLPIAQQGTIEQARQIGRGRVHGRWYASAAVVQFQHSPPFQRAFLRMLELKDH